MKNNQDSLGHDRPFIIVDDDGTTYALYGTCEAEIQKSKIGLGYHCEILVPGGDMVNITANSVDECLERFVDLVEAGLDQYSDEL